MCITRMKVIVVFLFFIQKLQQFSNHEVFVIKNKVNVKNQISEAEFLTKNFEDIKSIIYIVKIFFIDKKTEVLVVKNVFINNKKYNLKNLHKERNKNKIVVEKRSILTLYYFELFKSFRIDLKLINGTFNNVNSKKRLFSC